MPYDYRNTSVFGGAPSIWNDQPFAGVPRGGDYRAPIVSYGASGLTPAGGMNLTSLTDYINQINQQAQTAANRARLPGSAGLEDLSTGNIKSELQGEVDPEELRFLREQAAERGAIMGVDPMSPNATTQYLGALHESSSRLRHQGEQDLAGAYARNPAAPLFNPSTQLMTPYEREQIRLAEEGLRRNPGHTGGGGGYPTAHPDTGQYIPPTSRTGTGATAADLLGGFKPDATQAWWNSIGFNPNAGQGGIPGTGTTYFGEGPANTGADMMPYGSQQTYGPPNLQGPGLYGNLGESTGRPGRDSYGNLNQNELITDPDLYLP